MLNDRASNGRPQDRLPEPPPAVNWQLVEALQHLEVAGQPAAIADIYYTPRLRECQDPCVAVLSHHPSDEVLGEGVRGLRC